ncbi:MAG: type II toxin-antitoxin system HicA family toxin [Bacteroidales bacterium]|nr:type II toxin-antitoxin system HicA family toxin [Bacteroidales bacterium]
MKRSTLVRYLVENGCSLFKEGSNHIIFINNNGQGISSVPRHVEIGDRLAGEICKQLGIPKIK